jgi:hypothetical protein
LGKSRPIRAALFLWATGALARFLARATFAAEAANHLVAQFGAVAILGQISATETFHA